MNNNINNIKFYSGMSWLLLEKLLRVPTSFVVNLFLVRYLGPESFGELTYAVLCATLLTFLSNIGLPMITQQQISNNKDPRIILSNVIAMRLIFGFVAFSLTAGLAWLFFQTSKVFLFIFILSIQHLLQPFHCIADYLRSKAKQKLIAISLISQNIVISSLKITLILMSFRYEYVVGIYFLEFLFISVIYIILLYKYFGFLQTKLIDLNVCKSLLRSSYPLALGSLAVFLQSNIDRFLINEYLDLEALGIYSTSFMLISAFYFLPQIMSSTFMPMIIKYQQDKLLQEKVLVGLYSFSLWTGFLIMITFSIISGFIVDNFFNNDFDELKVILPLHSLLLPIIFLASISNAYIVSKNLVWFSLLRSSIGAVLSIIFILLFIKDHSLTGVIVSVISAQFISNIILDLLNKWTASHPLLKIRAFNPLSIKFLYKIRNK